MVESQRRTTKTPVPMTDALDDDYLNEREIACADAYSEWEDSQDAGLWDCTSLDGLESWWRTLSIMRWSCVARLDPGWGLAD